MHEPLSSSQLDTIEKRVIEWFRKRAAEGFLEAQSGLREMYAKGDLLPQNDEEALFWSNVARLNSGSSYYSGNSSTYEKNLSPVQVAAVKKRVEGWQTQHPLDVRLWQYHYQY